MNELLRMREDMDRLMENFMRPLAGTLLQLVEMAA